MKRSTTYEVASGALVAVLLAFGFLLLLGNSAGRAAATAALIGVGAAVGIYLGRSTAYRRAERYRRQAQRSQDSEP